MCYHRVNVTDLFELTSSSDVAGFILKVSSPQDVLCAHSQNVGWEASNCVLHCSKTAAFTPAALFRVHALQGSGEAPVVTANPVRPYSLAEDSDDLVLDASVSLSSVCEGASDQVRNCK